jgi:aminoglycoside 3-N-acetyltransferase
MPYNLQRRSRRTWDRLFARVGREAFSRALQRLKVQPGDVICVHSELSQLGHLVGGADMLVDGLMEAVGGSGCVMMPTFPTSGSSLRHLEEGHVFDVRTTPSKVGALTEVFRRRPGVSRSMHPTNPVSAWGEPAEALLRDHERSGTPFGYETPYGRLAEHERGYILMLGVPILSLLHHLQERVDFPNLYMAEPRRASYVDWSGQTHRMETKVILPRIPYFVAVPSRSEGAPDWAILHDYALMFPRAREKAVRRMGYRFDGYPKLYERRGELERAGILRATRLGKCEIGLLQTRQFIRYVEPELRALIARFRDHYDPARLAALKLPYS